MCCRPCQDGICGTDLCTSSAPPQGGTPRHAEDALRRLPITPQPLHGQRAGAARTSHMGKLIHHAHHPCAYICCACYLWAPIALHRTTPNPQASDVHTHKSTTQHSATHMQPMYTHMTTTAVFAQRRSSSFACAGSPFGSSSSRGVCNCSRSFALGHQQSDCVG